MLQLIFLLSVSCIFASDNEGTPLQYDILSNQPEQPNRLGQCAAATLNWLLCCCGLTCDIFACCTRMPEPICEDPTSCNPLGKHIDSYQPAQEGLCHEGCFLACPCLYRNQIPYEGLNEGN